MTMRRIIKSGNKKKKRLDFVDSESSSSCSTSSQASSESSKASWFAAMAKHAKKTKKDKKEKGKKVSKKKKNIKSARTTKGDRSDTGAFQSKKKSLIDPDTCSIDEGVDVESRKELRKLLKIDDKVTTEDLMGDNWENRIATEARQEELKRVCKANSIAIAGAKGEMLQRLVEFYKS